MTNFVALLRGLNVGGHHIVKMAELRELFAELGFEGVRTYVQSGNVVFRAAKTDGARLETRISAAFTKRFGFESPTLVRSAADWGELVEGNPFSTAAAADGTKVHAAVLASRLRKEELRDLEAMDCGAERWALGTGALYLHTPAGLARSKLATQLPRCLKTAWTQRNWRTVLRVNELLAADSA